MRSSKHLFRWLLLFGIYSGLAGLSLVASFFLRFDFALPESRIPILLSGLLLVVPLKATVLYFVGFYDSWGRHVGMADALTVLWANLITSGWFGLVGYVVLGPQFPRSIYVLDFLICFLMTTAVCFAARIRHEARCLRRRSNAKGILIYGAGSAGTALAREIRTNAALDYHVVGFLDDNPALRKAIVTGAPVLGAGHEARRVIEKCRRQSKRVDEIVIALPAATAEQRKKAIEACQEAGVPCKIVPGIAECLEGKVIVNDRLRKVNLSDLLGREPVRLDTERIREALDGRSILVTGAGGSIGSELCRQICAFDPMLLVALDQAESDLFRIDLELRKRFPQVQVVPCIGDIRDLRKIDDVLRFYAFDAVFHAAAYKHVPMMENNPVEAVRTNIVGTFNVARAACKTKVPRFVMISSDKAVNPANLMGLTKRAAELVVGGIGNSSAAGHSQFVSVRFGNVLGSNGSVVPIFEQQIAEGGPVTVTDPKVRRYFMTIPEAVQLVLQASTMGKRNEVFVLDMGEPVRIADLARKMIRLSGLEPDKDIRILYTGLRPGEKLFEELTAHNERSLPTYHETIRILEGSPPTWDHIADWMAQLCDLLNDREENRIVGHLAGLVPEYEPGELWKHLISTSNASGNGQPAKQTLVT